MKDLKAFINKDVLKRMRHNSEKNWVLIVFAKQLPYFPATELEEFFKHKTDLQVGWSKDITKEFTENVFWMPWDTIEKLTKEMYKPENLKRFKGAKFGVFDIPDIRFSNPIDVYRWLKPMSPKEIMDTVEFEYTEDFEE